MWTQLHKELSFEAAYKYYTREDSFPTFQVFVLIVAWQTKYIISNELDALSMAVNASLPPPKSSETTMKQSTQAAD